MNKLTKKVASAIAISAVAASTTMPAMAFDLRKEANLMAYWKIDLGPSKRDEGATAFGFAANKDLNIGKSTYSYDFNGYEEGLRPAFVDVQFKGLDNTLDSVSFAGTNVLTKTERLNADGSSEIAFGLNWWQIGIGVIAVGTAGYLIADALDDDDDDDSSGGGGGGTTGTPADEALDPLAAQSPF